MKEKLLTYKAWNHVSLLITSLVCAGFLAAAIRVFVFPADIESNPGLYALYTVVGGVFVFSVWGVFLLLDERV